MVKKPRNDAQIKVKHVAEFFGKQGAMRDDLIEVEPTNIKGLMASVDQCFELVQLVWCLFPKKVLLLLNFSTAYKVAGMVSIVMRKL